MSAVPRPHSRRARRRQDLRLELMRAVERLLEQGEEFAELSVDRLATEAGISRSTFYIYFEDKTDLLHASFEHVMAELDDAAMAWWSLDASSVTPAQLRGALADVLRTYHPHARALATIFDASAHDPVLGAEVEAFMERGIVGLRRHIAQNQERGLVDPALEPDATARWLFWMAERGQHQMTAFLDSDALGPIIDTYTAIVWRTLYAFAPARAAAA